MASVNAFGFHWDPIDPKLCCQASGLADQELGSVALRALLEA